MTAGSRIVAMGHYQPSRVVTNEALAATIDTNDEWIRSRVGIAERRVADSESVADMATFAAEKALAASGLSAADIDLVTVATCSAVDRCPNVATRVATLGQRSMDEQVATVTRSMSAPVRPEAASAFSAA